MDDTSVKGSPKASSSSPPEADTLKKSSESVSARSFEPEHTPDFPLLSSSALPYSDYEKQEIEALTYLENSRLIAQYIVAMEKQDEELVKKIKWKIVLANIPLIYSIAWPIFKKYRCADKGFEIEDLVSLGYDGVLRALVTFDPTRNLGFATYAGWWIRSFIIRYIHDHDTTMRIPQYIHEKIPKIRLAEDFFLMQGRADCSDQEIAERLGWDEREVSEIRSILRRSFTPLDGTGVDGEDRDVFNSCPDSTHNPENLILTEAWHALVRDLLSMSPNIKGSLTTPERCVLKLRFGITSEDEKLIAKIHDNAQGKLFKEIIVSYDGQEKTLEEIGSILGITRERVRQIELSALRKLRRLYYTQFVKEADPANMTLEELSLIQLLHERKTSERPKQRRSRRSLKSAVVHESENLTTLRRFVSDKDIIVG